MTHEGSGQLIYVPALSPHIDAKTPIYGLPAIPAFKPQLQTVEEMAMRLVRMIRATQATGPYRVAGWSFGGVLAYEVAAQLVGAGQKVDFVGLIDTPYSEGGAHLVDACRCEFDDKSRLLSEIQEIVLDHPSLNDDERLQVISEMNSAAATSDFEGLVQKCREMLLLPSRWADLTVVQLRQSLSRMYSYRLAELRYSAPPIAIPVHVFRAQDRNIGSPFLGWNTVLPESQIRVIELPGTHLSMMTTPNVAILGQALSDATRHAALANG